MRALVRETRLSPDNFLYPLFVRSGEGQRHEIASMPGVFQLSVDEAVKEAAAARAEGIPGVLLFGLPDAKDSAGSAAYDAEAPVQSAIRALKRDVPDLLVVTDVCLCEYTSHGHCGIIVDDEVANDLTVEQLVRAALSHAAAGADIVAPSDMMDGRVGRIRDALDARRLQPDGDPARTRRSTARRSTVRSAKPPIPHRPSATGARHQMDPANVEEALREVRARPRGRCGHHHGQAGAPLPRRRSARVKTTFGVPTAAYHVSGEYAMLKAAARNGWIDEPRAMMETLTSIHRAGADIIVTYYAREAARALK